MPLCFRELDATEFRARPRSYFRPRVESLEGRHLCSGALLLPPPFHLWFSDEDEQQTEIPTTATAAVKLEPAQNVQPSKRIDSLKTSPIAIEPAESSSEPEGESPAKKEPSTTDAAAANQATEDVMANDEVLKNPLAENEIWLGDLNPGEEDDQILDELARNVIGQQSALASALASALPTSGPTVDGPELPSRQSDADDRVTAEAKHWQNPEAAFDVNADRKLTPSDALVIINFLNAHSSHRVRLPDPVDGQAPPPYLDVNGDGFAGRDDVLILVQKLNKQSQ